MKKFFAIIFIFVAALGLVACNGEKDPTEPTGTGTGTTPGTVVREFAHDGTFIAFEVSTEGKAAQVSWVEVTIKNDKITKFFIDELQSKLTKNEAEEFDGMVWNEKSKKELGYFYGMHQYDLGIFAPLTEANIEEYKTALTENDKLEWFEQAELLEAKWLADGTNSVGTDEEGYLDGLAGATIVGDNYIRLAKEAVANAKAGKHIAFDASVESNNAQLVWATATVEDGKVKTLVIDTVQSKTDAVEGTLWNEKSKQELGYFYGMHQYDLGIFAPLTEANIEEYKTALTENELLEWFEQVDIIAADVVANGKPASLDAIAGVTIVTNHYFTVINAIYSQF